MAGISSTSFKLALFGALLLTVSASASTRTSSIEGNIIREVVAQEEALKMLASRHAFSALNNVEIIMKPKTPLSTNLGNCVGADGSCGPLFLCCSGLECKFDLNQFRFKCW